MSADVTAPNALRVSPRPAGSGRPNKGRKLTSLYLDEWQIEAADTLAEAEQVNRSEMLRRLISEALRARAEFHREERP